MAHFEKLSICSGGNLQSKPSNSKLRPKSSDSWTAFLVFWLTTMSLWVLQITLLICSGTCFQILKSKTNTDVQYEKKNNHFSTRHVIFGKCLLRTLKQWDSLESYFLSNFNLDDDPSENDRDEKPSREKRL